uniref:Uncharacterized protein n=1 Tax=Macrostomum lignano TaxID=282301 RepID=A0A1I8IHJ2_9PLAT
MRLVPRRGHH